MNRSMLRILTSSCFFAGCILLAKPVMAEEQIEEPIAQEEVIVEETEVVEVETDVDTQPVEDVQEEIVQEDAMSEEPEVEENLINYSTHIQNIGWQEQVSDGDMSGTSGKSLRLEGIKIELGNDVETEGGIEYRTHIQNIGWEKDVKRDGEMSGTSGKAYRLEAIQIRLYGKVAELYDVLYRVHVQEFGWLEWAHNWEMAGSQGYAYRLEGIEIKMLKKEEHEPTSSQKAFMTENGFNNHNKVQYQTHIQNVGWQEEKYDGVMSGTSGKSLRLEGIKIKLADELKDRGSIEYRTHIQNIGWENEAVKDGKMSGTSGKALRLEGIQIRLIGDVANDYNVLYRVHVQEFGWLDWASNWQMAGSEGYGYRLEGIEIKLIDKNATVTNSGKFFISKNGNSSVNYVKYQSHIATIGWQEEKYDGSKSGTTGKGLRIEGIKIEKANEVKDIEGDIIYRSHVQNLGWEENYAKNGELSGTSGQSLQIEAIQVNLTGALKEQYDIYYRAHSEQFGWLGWAKNGESAGTEGASYRIEAIEIKLLKKEDVNAPETSQSFHKIDQYTPTYYSQRDSRWANRTFGAFSFGDTGCVSTSTAMAINGILKNGVRPVDVGEYLYNHTTQYNRTNYGANGLAIKYGAEHWGLKTNGINSLNSLKECLRDGNIVVYSVGPGNFCGYGITHAIALFKSKDDRTYVYDPNDAKNNGWYSIQSLWDQRSTDPMDRNGGYIGYGIFK